MIILNKYSDRPVFLMQIIFMQFRVFANGPGDWGSIPGQVIPKTQKKMILDTSLLNTQCYKVHIRVKWSNPGKRVAPSLCSSYWKGSLRVALIYNHQLYLLSYLLYAIKYSSLIQIIFKEIFLNHRWDTHQAISIPSTYHIYLCMSQSNVYVVLWLLNHYQIHFWNQGLLLFLCIVSIFPNFTDLCLLLAGFVQKLHITFLCSLYLAFSPRFPLASK